MTPDQQAAVLDSLRAGVEPARAARAVRLAVADLREYARTNDAFAEELEAAEAEGAAERRRAALAIVAPEPPSGPPPVRAADAVPMARTKAVDSDGKIDIARVEQEAAAYGPGLFGFLLWQEDRLQAAGFHAMSDYWRWGLGDFYASRKRWGIAMAGRGASKSTTLTRVATCEAVFAERHVPPGQRWVWPFISVSSQDAARRIQEISAILTAIGVVPTREIRGNNPTIEIDDAGGNPVAFVSLASTIAGVSGPNAIGATIDEEAKLRDRVTNANPASEILASLVQTFRARDNIRAIRCSSAWTKLGSHYGSVMGGDTAVNYVFRLGAFVARAVEGLHEVALWEEQHGRPQDAAIIRAAAATLTAQSPEIPTWVGNPTISAIASREEVDALPETALGGVSRAAFWLRENASFAFDGGVHRGPVVDQCTGLADRVREMLGEDSVGLTRFPGLAAGDPRARAMGASSARRRILW